MPRSPCAKTLAIVLGFLCSRTTQLQTTLRPAGSSKCCRNGACLPVASTQFFRRRGFVPRRFAPLSTCWRRERSNGSQSAGPTGLTSEMSVTAQPADVLLADHRATIDLVGRNERDLGIGSLRSRFDLLVGNELAWRKARVEYDKDLLPQRLESITLNGIDHRKEILFLIQVLGREDLVNTRVLRNGRGRSIFGQLHHVDGEQLTVVESWHLTSSAVHARRNCETRMNRESAQHAECRQRKECT